MDEPSNPTIYSVSEMIDRAFGPPDQNIVDMKLIQAVLVILGRRLNVLDRWVPLEATSYKKKLERDKHLVSVTEVKIHAIKKPMLKIYLRTRKTRVLKSKDHSHKVKEQISSTAVPLSENEMRQKKTEEEKSEAKKGAFRTSKGESSSSKEKYKEKKDKLESFKEYYEDEGFEKGGRKTSKGEVISGKKRSQPTKETIESTKKNFEDKSLESEDSIITPEQDEDYDDVLAILSELQRLPEEKWSSSDLQEEKLLIVDLHDENIEKSTQEIADGSAVVTQDQFQRLLSKVIEYQKQYGTHDIPDFPDKKIKKQMQESASLSHAIGAMQLSAKMDVIESTTERLFAILREIVIKKIKQAKAATRKEQELEEEEEEKEEEENGERGRIVEKEEKRDREEGSRGGRREIFLVATPLIVLTTETTTEPFLDTQSAVEHVIEEDSVRIPTAAMSSVEETLEAEQSMNLGVIKKYITVQELEIEMWHMYDECFQEFLAMMKHCNASTAISKERCAKYGAKLKDTLIVEEVTDELEEKIKKYTSQIDQFDSECTAKTSSIQEQLSKMHQDLESGLMDFFEACSKQPKRHVAIAELINQFMDIYDEIVESKASFEELREKQEGTAEECCALWKELEVIKDGKSTRQGLQEALAYKASLQELNGYIQKIQGLAVQGAFERRIKRAYEKFNTHEVIWQKHLDDLTRCINDKVDLEQLDTFENMTRSIFNKIQSRLDAMIELVGDVPRISNIKKKMQRKKDCISCGAPVTTAMKDYEKENEDPNVLEDRAKGGKGRDRKLRKDKESEVCFPGLPVPHARDPRARVCSKYCGSSSTSLQLPTLHTKRLRKEMLDAVEGEIVEEKKKTPCIACNKPILPPLPGYTSKVEALCDEFYTGVLGSNGDPCMNE